MVITIVASYAFLKFLVRKMRDQFRKYEAAGMHPPLCVWGADRVPRAVSPFFDSNRSRPKFTLPCSWERACVFSQSTLPDTSVLQPSAEVRWIGLSQHPVVGILKSLGID